MIYGRFASTHLLARIVEALVKTCRAIEPHQ